MSNRSHLYTCDEVPGGKGFHARGLSEYNWDVPLVHKLMAAGNPRIVRSAIWEHDVGILADREGAFARTLALFDKIGEGDLSNRAEFDEELSQMKEFLSSTPPSKYVLLEAGEILDMMDGELPTLIANLHAELSPLAAKAERAVAGNEDVWLGQLRAEWEEQARPGYWSDILYYSFDDKAAAAPVPGAPPAKATKAAKTTPATASKATPATAAKAAKPGTPAKAAKPGTPAKAAKPGTAAKAAKPATAKAAKKPIKKAAAKSTKKPTKAKAKMASKPAKKSAKAKKKR